MYKPTPGPQGLSCLTCRQRRKKCDKNRPLCDRCAKGGFECLGYDNNGDGRDRGGKTSPPESILPLPTAEILPDIRDGMTTVEMPTKIPNKSFDTLISGSSFELPSPTTNSIPLVNNLIDSHLESHCNFGWESPNNCYDPIDHLSSSGLSSITYFNDLWPQNQTHSLVRRRSLRGSPSTVERSPLPLRGQLDFMGHLDAVMRGPRPSIPRSVDVNNSMRSSYLTFILDVYQTQRARKLFQSPPEHLRSALVARMKRSGTMLWFMYLGAHIFEAFSKVPENAVVAPYTHLVNKFDQQITTYSDRNPSIEDLEDRLSAMLELVFLKFVTIGTGAGYSLLRRSLPTFFQVVSSDSTLWSEGQGLLVSFPRALASHRHEVRRFTFYDTMLAFILGLPPMVEYDVSEFLAETVQAQPFEWVHGIPIDLIVNIVQVNGWRAVVAGVPHSNEWVELEVRAIAWKPNVQEIIGGDSSELVVRLAVQEAWRHAVLIYIYMGMAGFLSDDIRVQHSVRQIVKLFNIESSSPIDAHFVIPCIVSGIAARYEHQRTTIREKLLSFRNMRVWFCPGSDFVKVLDHLWHGVGRDGVAVTWEDYVYSRSDVFPV